MVSPVPTIWRKAATGVTVSATSSRHTGTMRWAPGERPEALDAGAGGVGHGAARGRSPAVSPKAR